MRGILARGLFILSCNLPWCQQALGQDITRWNAALDSSAKGKANGDPQSAMKWANAALAAATHLKDSTAMPQTLVARSGIRMITGDLSGALTDLHDALDIYTRTGNADGIATVYNSIGSIHYYDGNYERSREYYQKSLEIRRQQDNLPEIATLLGNIGSVLEELGHPDSALVYHRSNLHIRQASGQTNWIPVCYGNLGECFDKLGMQDSALHYLKASVGLFAGSPHMQASVRAMYAYGLALLHAGRGQMAIGQCTRALALATSLGDKGLQKDCSLCLYQAHASQGNTVQALRHFERYVAIRDSMTNEQRDKEVIRLDMNYDFERTRLADSLVQADHQHQAELTYRYQLSRERDQKRIYILAALAVVALSVGLWRRLRFIQRSRKAIQFERDRSERLLRNILPGEIAEELKNHGHVKVQEVKEVSILFTDFHDFTKLGERMNPQDLVAEIDACFQAFDEITLRHGLEKIKTIGDAYMCAGGLPAPRPGSAEATVRAGLEMQQWLMDRAAKRSQGALPAFYMRAGIHTGEVVAGVVGKSKFQYDVWGDTVNIAARMESSGAVGEVNISEATYLRVKHDPDLCFVSRGHITTKGKGELAMYFVRPQKGRDAQQEAEPRRKTA